MARDYIRTDAIPDPEGVRIFINPTWRELCVALHRIQRGCKSNRIPESRLKKLYDQAKGNDFFSACLMTADEAPGGYGFPYRSTQAAACRLAGVTGFILKRTTTNPGDFIKYPIYALTPRDNGFNYQDWLDSVARIFWTHLTDAELEALNMKPLVAKLRKEYQGKRKRRSALHAYVKKAKWNPWRRHLRKRHSY